MLPAFIIQKRAAVSLSGSGERQAAAIKIK